MTAAKQTSHYVCQACGASHGKWSGKCDACGEWNTLVEEAAPSGPGPAAKAPRGKGIPIVGLQGETAPPPRTVKTAGQRGLYALVYVVGVVSLIAAYAPLGHQEALNAFLGRFSAGRASFTSLAQLVVIFLPMAASFAIIVPLLERDRRRMAAGLADEAEVLRLQTKQEWLFAFAAAFVMTGFTAFLAGNMILNFL